MKQHLSTILFLIIANIVPGQNNKQDYFQGYVEEVQGKRFGYHSPFPDVNTSLILRGEEDYTYIEWKT